MAEQANWYVAHTYSGYENKVATDLMTMVENRHLQDLICDVKVPTETRIEEVFDKRGNKTGEKEVQSKLYPGYVFIKMVMNDNTWYIVRNTRGCTGFVGPESKPEPLTEAEVEVLFSIINMLKARGVGIVYISHKMKEIWRIADDVTVMRDGRWITTRHKTEYGTDDDSFRAEVIRNMCGRELSAAYPPKDNIVHDDPMIVVEGLTAKYNQLRDASFTLHKGEILGVAGLDGSGRSELLETLFGYRTRQSGTIKKFNFGFRAAQGGTPEDYSMEVHDINGTQVGEEISNLSPNSAIKQGFALVTEERRATGIFGILDIRANTVIANLKNYKLGKFPLLSDAKMARDTDRMIEAMHIKTPSQRQQIKNLSGGNQQKIILAREMENHPELLVAVHPTRGLDIGASQYVHDTMIEARDKGCGILLISADFDEVLKLSDRILVMLEGQVMGIYSGENPPVEEISLAMAGKEE